MAGEWKRMILDDAIDLISGGTPKTSVPEYWGGDIPWLSVADFNTGYRWVSSAEKSITDPGLSESATTVLNKRDIIISARGTVGVVAQLTKPMAFNQSCYGVRGRSGIADTDFIYYLMRQAVSEMKQVAHGGVFDTITRNTFKIIEVDLPPLPEQQAIAYILGVLDDKIELNRRMNRTLEATARAVFKSWFVDFDPVRAKAEGGKPPGLAPHIVELFPDWFKDSELGRIPKSWDVQPFADTIDIIGGGTPKTSIAEYWDGEIPWFSIVDAPVNNGIWVINTKKEITQAGVDNSSTRILPQGTTIISARGTVGRVVIVGRPMAMNQSCYGLRGKADKHGFYTYFSTCNLVKELQQRAHGSVFNTITRDTLKSVIIVLPPSKLIQKFEMIVAPVLEGMRNNLFQSHSFADIRDTLLSKLISGDLRVPDAERIVERCV